MSRESAVEVAALGESGPVALRDVEGELTRRLKAVQGPGMTPVHRAHMSNLVIFCDDSGGADAVEALIPAIVAAHPARVLLAVGEPGVESREVSATLHVRALRAGEGPRVYSEQITLRAAGRGVDHLPYAVRGLLIGDLPTNVWWASHTPPPLAGPLLHDLAERAQQVIFDSLAWIEPNRGVYATSGWLAKFEHEPGSGKLRIASDLNWRRLKTWRRLMSQALDPASAPGAIGSITEVAMEHGPHAVTQAWQLASWLASRLGWKVQGGRVQEGVELSWQLIAPHGPLRLRIRRRESGPAEVSRVRITCMLEGVPTALAFEDEDGRLSARPEGLDAAPRTLTDPPQSIAELVVPPALRPRARPHLHREHERGPRAGPERLGFDPSRGESDALRRSPYPAPAKIAPVRPAMRPDPPPIVAS